MGREEQINMETQKRAELIHDLELKHQHGADQSEILSKDEDVRRLRLRILMLRDENTSLRDQITQNNDTNAMLAAKCEDLGTHLEAKMETARLQEQQLRKQEREFTSLKAELHSMTNLTQDSSNLLAEKLSLTRELAVLKPEMDHLRSQLTHLQATLAEKLALERQVNTLEVELANEKKATRRAMQKRESNDQVEDELRKKLREAEKQLTSEKTQRERLEDQLAQQKHTHHLALQDQDSTRDMETDLRKKLQDVQRQLREQKAERENLEEELHAERQLGTKAQRKETSSTTEDELRTKLRQTEEKLAAERKEKERIRSDTSIALTEAVTRNDNFEKKIEKMKAKMRETLEELKQCQADLRKAQQAPKQSASDDFTVAAAPSTTVAAKPAAAKPIAAKPVAVRPAFRKRKANEIAADDFTQITIETPGADDDRPRRGIKKKILEPTVVGEKSMFSITPFLNRTKNLSDDATVQDNEEMDDTFSGQRGSTRVLEVTTTTIPLAVSDESMTSSIPSEPSGTPSLGEDKPKTKRGRPKKILGDAPSAKQNAQPALKTVLKKAAKPASFLETSAGPSEPTTRQDTERTQTVKFDFSLPRDDSTTTASANTSKGEEPKKKKRKVLGSAKTLFDDDEGEAPLVRQVNKAPLGGKRVKAPLGGGVRSAFAGASFSPLKKERRGVGASFLV